MAPPKETDADHTIPKPSASVILISSRNEVLLLHRVQTSSSFPSAHVFPGGNISSQDGDFPPAGHSDSHDEGPHYRRAAIRELFEESGILLAKNRRTGKMIYVDTDQREIGRHAIHKNKITFNQWLAGIDEGAELDIDRPTYSVHTLDYTIDVILHRCTVSRVQEHHRQRRERRPSADIGRRVRDY
ncbi:hypothetical protein I7I51_04067 [Histoplasma capsulatum]|uniref:Nudix hydrolase domain-containing protein n=1 Tax=Ajellomyces capsulatus TaxID=5037 RepID=A0A8A1M9G4_AJECA|nr:hypothetical protein I7I51_04067 [Histoplasma capsulatum]